MITYYHKLLETHNSSIRPEARHSQAEAKNLRFEVELLSIGRNKEALERLLRQVKGLRASPAEITESCPCLLAENISATASKKLKQYLEHVGAHVIIRRYHQLTAAAPPPDANGNGASQPSSALPSEDLSAQQPKHAESPSSMVPPPPVMPQQAAPDWRGSVTAHIEAQQQASQKENGATGGITLKRSVAELTHALKDKRWQTREAALVELSGSPSNGVIQHIVGVLKDDVWQVRKKALEVLGNIGSSLTIKEMVKCVEDDVWAVREQAIDALSRMQSDKIVKPLLTATSDEQWQIRLRAVQVLGELRTKRAINSLQACLQDDVWLVRENAAKALGALRSEKAVKALSLALQDSNWHVRSMAVSALWQINSEKSVQALVEALSDANWMVHWKAAYALGKIGTLDALPVLSRFEQESASPLRDAVCAALRSLDIVAEPRQRTRPRLEYRSEAPYATMSYIPSGHFVMGHDEAADNAKPGQDVFLHAYYIDTYAVTNAQYACCNPSHKYPEGMDAFPVVNINWEEANAYANWIGKRLPTEAEWEKAARSEDGRLYPWGNEFLSSACNTVESENHRVTQVDLHPEGKSKYGVFDMIGNVLEWTVDRYLAYPWSQDESPDYDEQFIVLRGGSWLHSQDQATCVARLYAPPENRSNFIGFRCVKDVEHLNEH